MGFFDNLGGFLGPIVSSVPEIAKNASSVLADYKGAAGILGGGTGGAPAQTNLGGFNYPIYFPVPAPSEPEPGHGAPQAPEVEESFFGDGMKSGTVVVVALIAAVFLLR